jgi:3D (Asp-Asp-Asp) domain-containing protein
MVDEQGRVSQVWFRFLQQLVNQPAASAAITVSASPFTYTASFPGNVVINGGTVTGLSVSRGTTSVTVATTQKIIPLGQGDSVVVTYSVLPTMTWLPS